MAAKFSKGDKARFTAGDNTVTVTVQGHAGRKVIVRYKGQDFEVPASSLDPVVKVRATTKRTPAKKAAPATRAGANTDPLDIRFGLTPREFNALKNPWPHDLLVHGDWVLFRRGKKNEWGIVSAWRDKSVSPSTNKLRVTIFYEAGEDPGDKDITTYRSRIIEVKPRYDTLIRAAKAILYPHLTEPN